MVDGVTRIDLPPGDWALPTDAPVVAVCANRTASSPAANPSFIAGRENRVAVRAIERLLSGEDPSSVSSSASLFNPLIVVGPSGSGKSMLARGVARRWLTLLGEQAVAYFSAADFGRELLASRTDRRLGPFCSRLAGLRLLIVDDLQRLSPRAFVQRQLRDAIDAIVEAGGSVVVTAQQTPTTMAALEQGLRDRLAAGLTVRLQPHGVEARQEILHQAAVDRGSSIGSDRLALLAQRVEGAVPRLLGALSSLDAAEPGDAPRPEECVTLKQIVTVVARYYSVSQAALRSAVRRKSLVHVRGIVVLLARDLTSLSYAKIGEGLGRRDHTTILHAHRTTKALLTNDLATQQAIDDLRRILTAV